MWGFLKSLLSLAGHIGNVKTLVGLFSGCCGTWWASTRACPEDVVPYLSIVVGAFSLSCLIGISTVHATYAGWRKWYQPKVDITAYDGKEVSLIIRPRSEFSEGECEVTGKLSGPGVGYRSPFTLCRGSIKAYVETKVVVAEFAGDDHAAQYYGYKVKDHFGRSVHSVNMLMQSHPPSPQTAWINLNVKVRFDGLRRSSDHQCRFRFVERLGFEVEVVNTGTT